jgi:hypothetical protein
MNMGVKIGFQYRSRLVKTCARLDNIETEYVLKELNIHIYIYIH